MSLSSIFGTKINPSTSQKVAQEVGGKVSQTISPTPVQTAVTGFAKDVKGAKDVKKIFCEELGLSTNATTEEINKSIEKNITDSDNWSAIESITTKVFGKDKTQAAKKDGDVALIKLYYEAVKSLKVYG